MIFPAPDQREALFAVQKGPHNEEDPSHVVLSGIE